MEKYIKMNNIISIYKNFSDTPGDINEHLPTLKKYGEMCEHITEMGARWGCSTFAFLSAKPKKFVSYDINDNKNIDLAKNLALTEGVNFEFNKKNVLDVEIEITDLLFIDTWHKYGQLKEELKLHKDKVKKYLIFHDTESYEFEDEPSWGGLYEDVRPLSNGKTGIWPAIQELLDEGEWVIEERFKNNNGLTILKRKK
jgi:hypothetical protein